MRRLKFVIIFGVLGVTPGVAVRANDAPWPVEQANSYDMVSASVDVLWTSSMASTGQPLQSLRALDNVVFVHEIGGPPSSSVLFLSAFLSLGLWQVARSSRDLQFAHLPNWYHAGGPVQVGHATPLDLSFSPLALCPLQTVNSGREVSSVSSYFQSTKIRPPKWLYNSVGAPRAPPVQTH